MEPSGPARRVLEEEHPLPRNQRPAPGKSLAEVRPDLIGEWDQEANDAVYPHHVRAGSGILYAWVCSTCGHRWRRDVYSRAVAGTGCNECADAARRRPKPGTSLAELRPDLVAEWDHEANGDLTPYDVTPGTGRVKVRWVCALGHRWPATPNLRTSRGPHGEHGCRDCAIIRSTTPEPGRSFGDLYPAIAAQLDPDKPNPDPFAIKPFCDQMAHWVCALGHRWESKVSNRALGNGCRHCKPTGWSFWEVRIRTELEACGLPIIYPHPRIEVDGRGAVAADIVMPSLRIIVECDGYGGHRWPDSLATDQAQTAALTAAGWTVIRVRQGLDAIGPYDVTVTKKQAVSTIVKKTLARLAELGVDVPEADYEQSGPWAVDKAEATIARYLRDGLPA